MSRDPTDPKYYASGSSPVPKFGFGIKMEGTPKQIKETTKMFKEAGGLVKAPGIATAADMFSKMKAAFESPMLTIFTAFFEAFGMILSSEIDYDAVINMLNTFMPTMEALAPLLGNTVNPALEIMNENLEDAEPTINKLNEAIDSLTGYTKDLRKEIKKMEDAMDDLTDRVGAFLSTVSGGTFGGGSVGGGGWNLFTGGSLVGNPFLGGLF